ncbi:trypsin-like serine protease [Tropicimonas isoalkanivorans]|uniref:V8-like Glu-specific endopeptidase n=1 Tax=Tropicimonas isoalkanivorans TaxID=441112 RepID=A0A1I1JDG5_9RHOB|nr:trypsin-like serine protease [Tropicimonas isoalkanivorans]SFC44668.1 V8-like Glu-specific endopeptidase [Tropicimonas isoalkanivorans]
MHLQGMYFFVALILLFPCLAQSQGAWSGENSVLLCAPDVICHGELTNPTTGCIFKDPSACNTETRTDETDTSDASSSDNSGSETPDENQFRPVVALINSTEIVECSGTLVGSNTVLTAAHCLCNDKHEVAEIIAGTSVPNSDEHDSRYDLWRFRVEDRLAYDDFCDKPEEERRLSPDVGLLFFANDKELHPRFIQSTNDPSFRGLDNLVIVGFGASESNSAGGRKRFAPAGQGFPCTSEAQDNGLPGIPSDEMDCALGVDFVVPADPGDDSPRVDTCYADSGGPILSYDYRLVGVTRRAVNVSGEDPCSEGGIYTVVQINMPWQEFQEDVQEYVFAWIKQNIR